MPLKHSRYINPLLDFSFKKIFGSDPNKDLLIDFLNEIFKGRKLNFYEGLGYTYIDLSNFVETKDECVSHLDNWLYSLKHLDEMDRLPPHLKKTIFETCEASFISIEKKQSLMKTCII